MRSAIFAPLAVAICCVAAWSNAAEKVLFQDDFKAGLSAKWQLVGLKKEDYRLRDGGLEMRVQPGPFTADTPMLKVMLPFTSAETAIASVKVTLLDKFTEDGEFAGVFLLDEAGREFAAKKERLAGKVYFSPGAVDFQGEEGEEGDLTKYKTLLVDESPEAGPLRIIVDRGDAFFQVGPSSKGKYHNHFYSAIRSTSKERGFGLSAGGAPKGSSHWVRFEDFRVER